MMKRTPAAFLFLAFLPLLVFLFAGSARKIREEKTLLEEKSGPADFFYLQRSWPDKHLDAAAYEAGIRQAGQQRLAAFKTASNWNAGWKTEGPGNIGGRVNALAIHPTNANIIYAGFANGGVWKTTNGGATWNPIFDQQNYLSIGAIAIDPVNPATIYVGTGDANVSGYPLVGDGIYKSVDGGNTWMHMGLSATKVISKITIDPSNTSILYVATMGLPMARDNNRGLYKSIDGGQSWSQVLFVHDDTGISDVLINPQNPQELFAVSWTNIRNNQEKVASGIYSRVFKSANGGNTWSILSNGLPQGNLSRSGICMYNSNPSILYVSVVDSLYDLKGIYKTMDGGNSWNPVPLNGLDMAMLSGFGWYFGKIVVNPANSNDVFILGVDLWRTTNGGGNWAKAAPNWWLYTVHADKHVLEIDGNGNFYLGTDGGLYKSQNDCASWSDVEDIPANEFYRVAYNPHDPSSYYGGMQDNGTSGGNAGIITSWPRLYGGDGFQPAFDPSDPNTSYAETQWGNIVYTDDGGNNYYPGTVGIDPQDRVSWDAPYVMNANNSALMYTGTYRVYSNPTSPYGQWWPISGDLTDGNIYGDAFHVISAIDNSKLDNQYVYAGTSDGNVWRTTDNGQNWSNISAGLPDRYVTSVKASPHALNTVYVTHSGYKSNEYIPHVHRSTDNGNSWTDISGDLPQVAVNDLLVYPANDSMLFVATDAGVYGTTNAGASWQRVGSNMPLVNVYDIEINTSENRLMAGTFGRSLMSFPLDSLFSGIKNTASQNTARLSPNPAKDFACLSFKGTVPGNKIKITIYDLEGKLILERDASPVNNAVFIDLRGFSPGTYLIKAEAGDLVFCKKLVKQ